MEKKNKKLQLNKETIRNLSDEHLEQVAGAGRGSAVIGCSVACGSVALCQTGISACVAVSCVCSIIAEC